MARIPEQSRFLGAVIDGRYRIAEELGVGATGVVFKGLQLAVDREVAIKVMHEELQVDSDFGQRFVLEAKAVARLDHPSILTLYDFGFWDVGQVHYMVTELVKGDPLENWMRGKQDLPVMEVLQIAAQVADGLAHAHDNNIIHRDMKPGNIMVRRTPYGSVRAKILDFGLAQLKRDGMAHKELTQPGMIYGTPLYMSPEQVLGQRDLTPAVDVYAFGIMLYELFEGRPPFYASSINEMLQQHLQSPPPPMVRARAPEEVEEMIYRCLEKDPAERIQSAEELLEVLYLYLAKSPADPSLEVPRTLFESTENDELDLEEGSAGEEIYDLTELPSLFDLGDSSQDLERDEAFHVGQWATSKPRSRAAVIGALHISSRAVISDEIPRGVREYTTSVKHLDVSQTLVGKSRRKSPRRVEPVKAASAGEAPGMFILKPTRRHDTLGNPADSSQELLPVASDSFQGLEEISAGLIATLNPLPELDLDPATSIEEMVVLDAKQTKRSNTNTFFLLFVIVLLVVALGFAIVDPYGWVRGLR